MAWCSIRNYYNRLKTIGAYTGIGCVNEPNLAFLSVQRSKTSTENTKVIVHSCFNLD